MDWIAYLDEVAAHPTTRVYRARARSRLAIQRGERVLEVGCGTGGDTPVLAAASGRTGLVVGLDRDPGLLAEAVRRRPRAAAAPVLVRADVLALPFAAGRFDACVADRVLHWLTDPAPAVAEIRRVLRPGGRAVLTEPDWSTLSFAPDGDPLTGRLERFYREGPAASRVGRSLGGLMLGAGFEGVAVEAFAGLVGDFDTAERLLRLDEALAHVADGASAALWRRTMLEAAARGVFGATLVGYTVLGRRPEGQRP
jgi:SAM-dependent methyltransferase